MSEIKLGDNPSYDTQLGILISALNRLVTDVKEIKTLQAINTEDVSKLKFYQREQNSNVANAVAKNAILENRLDAHDDWHGKEDEKLVKRLHEEELREARSRGKSEGVKTVLGIEYSVLRWVAGGGLVGIGLFLGKIVNLIGWW